MMRSLVASRRRVCFANSRSHLKYRVAELPHCALVRAYASDLQYTVTYIVEHSLSIHGSARGT